VRTDARPGIALRLTALAAVVSSLVAVVSGATGWTSAHRVVAALALPPLLALVVASVVAHRRLLAPSLAALALFGTAAAITAPGLHLASAALALAGTCGLAAACLRGGAVERGRFRDYLTLTKPRIMSLLLVTGACGMVVGAHGWPGTARLAVTMVGLALACGGASALNHVLDRDIDRLMGSRTAGRPVAYTGYLKRRGPQNIVLGGAAGAVPPLVGYAAATGNLALPALWLFLIVFLWTPPHFWALALLLREHYAAAKVPMLPVVRGERATVRRIVVYTLALVCFTVVPFALGAFGAVYLACALVLGCLFVVLALRLGQGEDRGRAALAFHYSLLYLALLFVGAAVDAAL
jgi:protoheme IX farnesyltransferase